MNNIGGIHVLDSQSNKFSRRFIENFRFSKELKSNLILLSDQAIEKNNQVWDGILYDHNLEHAQHNLSFDEMIQMDGKWAIGRYQSSTETIELLRDPSGICPLYYLQSKEFFAFASTLQLLLPLLLQKKLNYPVCYDLLALNRLDLHAEQFIESIKEVLPHEQLTYFTISGELRIEKTLHKNLIYHSDYNSPADIEKQKVYLRGLIEKSIESRQKNVVNPGVFLSGGLDSSILTYQMSKFGSSNRNIHALSICLEDAKLDESNYAREMALKSRHTKWSAVYPNTELLCKEVKDLHYQIGTPTLSLGSYLQYQLASKAKDLGLDGVFDGTGADSLFAGHWYHQFSYWNELIRHFQFVSFFSEFWYGTKQLRLLKLVIKQYLRRSGIYKLPSQMRGQIFSRTYTEWPYLNKEFLSTYSDRLEQRIDTLDHQLNKQLKAEFEGPPLRHLLRFMERFTRFRKLDVIFPYADSRELANFIWSLPSSSHIHRGVQKYLLREAYKDFLPGSVYSRQEKMGLVSPNNRWMSELKYQFREYFSEVNQDVFQLNKLLNDYEYLFDKANMKENYRLFKLMSFVIWRHVFSVE